MKQSLRIKAEVEDFLQSAPDVKNTWRKILDEREAEVDDTFSKAQVDQAERDHEVAARRADAQKRHLDTSTTHSPIQRLLKLRRSDSDDQKNCKIQFENWKLQWCGTARRLINKLVSFVPYSKSLPTLSQSIKATVASGPVPDGKFRVVALDHRDLGTSSRDPEVKVFYPPSSLIELLVQAASAALALGVGNDDFDESQRPRKLDKDTIFFLSNFHVLNISSIMGPQSNNYIKKDAYVHFSEESLENRFLQLPQEKHIRGTATLDDFAKYLFISMARALV